jgi:hypothetical protein
VTVPLPAEPIGSFLFQGAVVEAFLSPDGRWHLRSAGCEVVGDHLGVATRMLFDPNYNPTTRGLIDEILAWERVQIDQDVPRSIGEGWMTSPGQRHAGDAD